MYNISTVDAQFNGLCLLADNQPTNRLKSVSVKESPVGGVRINQAADFLH